MTVFTTHINGDVVESADVNLIQTAVNALEGPGEWLPSDQGFKAWNYDPIIASSQSNPTSQLLQVLKIRIPAGTVTNIHLFNTDTGTTTGFYAALYNGAAGGALLAQSANQSGLFGVAGMKTIPLVSPPVVTAGVYYAAFWKLSGTLNFVSTGANTGQNANLAATVARFGTANAGMSGAVAPANLGTITTLSPTFWVAVS